MKWCKEFNLALSSINAWRNGARLKYGGADMNGKHFENVKAAVEELKRQGFDPKNWALPEIQKKVFLFHLQNKNEVEEYRNLLEIDCCLNRLEKFLKGGCVEEKAAF